MRMRRAHMYPRVPIVVLEPEPANCWLLQANTRVFANVRVKCAGLWDKVRGNMNLAHAPGRSAFPVCTWQVTVHWNPSSMLQQQQNAPPSSVCSARQGCSGVTHIAWEHQSVSLVACGQVANLSIQASGDGREWGWRTVEVPQATPSTIPATSVPALLREFNLTAFDYAKIDIEGAEFAVFRGDSALSWLAGAKVNLMSDMPSCSRLTQHAKRSMQALTCDLPTPARGSLLSALSGAMQVLSLETHKALALAGEVEHLKNLLIRQGFQWSMSGEYDVWATAELQKRIVPA